MGIFKRKRPEAVTPEDRVYYSTPYGDTNDGKQKLFLLERDGVRYMPVFRSVDSMKQFYALKNRAAYMILEGDIDGLMNTNRSIELLKAVGIVIEPMSEHPVEIMPNTE